MSSSVFLDEFCWNVVPTLNAAMSLAQEVMTVDQVFTLFCSKCEMPIYTKVVSLNTMDNFHKGRF
jgi:hypothetical protein